MRVRSLTARGRQSPLLVVERGQIGRAAQFASLSIEYMVVEPENV
jgi:hypothetical protein